MRGAYSKKSDTLTLDKVTLTQRNIMNEMFKFYREHLHPLTPMPSFRHTLMWALQSNKYVLSWQFNFNGQMNWNATEANWRLAMDPRAAEDYDIVEAAAFVAESRTVRPGTWANDIYVGQDFMAVCMFAREQQDAEFAAQADNGTVNGDVPARPPTPAYPSTPANGIDLDCLAHDLAQLSTELETDLDDADDGDGASAHGDAPPGAPPAYRAAEANAMAAEESGSEEEEAPRKPRSRYVDDEADDTPEF